jgi:hypothetical protein
MLMKPHRRHEVVDSRKDGFARMLSLVRVFATIVLYLRFRWWTIRRVRSGTDSCDRWAALGRTLAHEFLYHAGQDFTKRIYGIGG